MILFNFDLCSYNEEDISPFDMGHIDITSDEIAISSKNKIPDQSMMLFISLTDLLDKIRKVLHSKSDINSMFSSTDSSFELLFKAKNDFITIENGANSIKVKKTILAKSLYDSASSFYEKYGGILEKTHHYYDLKNSVSDFAVSLDNIS